MKHSLFALLFAGAAVAALPAQAQTPAAGSASASASSSAAKTKPAAKKVVKKKAVKKTEAPVVVDEESIEPATVGGSATDYKCEMGNAVTIFVNNDDPNHIALKWGKRLHRMTRVATTTGAVRFENHYYGLVWIGIPSKGILLDSKQGRQLANDCKSPEQLAPQPAENEAPKTDTPKTTAPAVAPAAAPAVVPAAAPPAMPAAAPAAGSKASQG